MIRAVAVIACGLLGGVFLGVGIGICVNAHWSVGWAAPWSVVVLGGVVAGAWIFEP